MGGELGVGELAELVLDGGARALRDRARHTGPHQIAGAPELVARRARAGCRGRGRRRARARRWRGGAARPRAPALCGAAPRATGRRAGGDGGSARPCGPSATSGKPRPRAAAASMAADPGRSSTLSQTGCATARRGSRSGGRTCVRPRRAPARTSSRRYSATIRSPPPKRAAAGPRDRLVAQGCARRARAPPASPRWCARARRRLRGRAAGRRRTAAPRPPSASSRARAWRSSVTSPSARRRATGSGGWVARGERDRHGRRAAR